MGGVQRRSGQRAVCATKNAIGARASNFAGQRSKSLGSRGSQRQQRVYGCAKIVGNPTRLRQCEARGRRYRLVANFCVGNDASHAR